MFALVTGASGLLGRQLTAELRRRGHRVRAFDIKNISDKPDGVESVKGDIRNSDAARSACEGIDVVFHLAAVMPQSRSSVETFHSINVRGTENMLTAAVSESVKRFVYSSSVEIYGIPDIVPCTEDAPKKLLGTYSRNKLECEELCAKYSADFGIEVTMMRMPMLFGPGYYHEKFYLKMFEDVGRGKPIRIIGDGSNRHQVAASSDVAQAYILASETPGAAGEAFNIASDPAKVPTVRQMAEGVIQRLGSKSKVSFLNKTLARAAIRVMSAIGKPILMDEHREIPFVDYVFNIEKAKRILGYVPKKNEVEAIAETAEWYLKSQGLLP